jgi:hypothetical protein
VFFDQNHPDFTGFNYWYVIDTEYPEAVVGVFDKSGYNPYVDLGWFNPGQGRLYKITPYIYN